MHDPELRALLGDAAFYSITYRLFKVPGRIETLCEDYGQAIRYKASQAALKGCSCSVLARDVRCAALGRLPGAIR